MIRDIIGWVFFFFKQKTAYEMLRSLVGSEMCIRDRSKMLSRSVAAACNHSTRAAIHVNGLRMVDHLFEVPLNHFQPGHRRIAIFAREVTATNPDPNTNTE
eukprot:TRINITY_DN49588_c0_g1_i1.p3 TRINITY_DN49588_c0_g1~~TRINITY_DN49588_c0_g1_i1.p3  ORF type:complete len:101 (+),score=32.48 TRINITY_DN49588_c0_g1_i1:25-327(+)